MSHQSLKDNNTFADTHGTCIPSGSLMRASQGGMRYLRSHKVCHQAMMPSLEGIHHGCGAGGGSAVEKASKEWAVPQSAPKKSVTDGAGPQGIPKRGNAGRSSGFRFLLARACSFQPQFLEFKNICVYTQGHFVSLRTYKHPIPTTTTSAGFCCLLQGLRREQRPTLCKKEMDAGEAVLK